MAEDSSNALGLDFSQLTVEETQPESQETPVVDSPSQTAPDAPRKENKEKPYVNPERVKTGGSQRDKLTDEALEERMTRIREQNEKIKQRRIDVQADEDAFRKTQEVERAKQAQNRKIQSDIDRARDQNAKRKMDKVQSREWDSGKPAVDRSGQRPNRSQPAPAQTEQESAPDATSPSIATPEAHPESGGNWTRGGQPPPHPRGRGRGRGRGAGGRGGGNNNRRETAPSASASTEAPKTENNKPAPST